MEAVRRFNSLRFGLSGQGSLPDYAPKQVPLIETSDPAHNGTCGCPPADAVSRTYCRICATYGGRRQGWMAASD